MSIKSSNAAKKRWQNPEYRKKVSKAISKGRLKRKEELGYLNSSATRIKLSKAHKGNHHNEETKLKMSKSRKGSSGLWMLGRHHTKETKHKMKTTLRKHHIFLKENSDEIMELTVAKHRQLHTRVYEYVYDKYGEEGINNYLKWFDKKYKLINIKEI